jgi:hypothetical protein
MAFVQTSMQLFSDQSLLPRADLVRLSNAGGEMIASSQCRKLFPEKNHEKGSAELIQKRNNLHRSIVAWQIVIFNSFNTEEILCRYPSKPQALTP